MRFGPAIDDVLKFGYTAYRKCEAHYCFIGFRLPDDQSDLTGGYFYKSFEHGNEVITVPWTPDTFDMTAHDWIVNERN
jgi:hypothetical protein